MGVCNAQRPPGCTTYTVSPMVGARPAVRGRACCWQILSSPDAQVPLNVIHDGWGDRWQVLVPPLRELENYIFNQMFNFLWSIMVDFAASDAAGVPVGRPPLHPPSREETAIWRWLEALQASLTGLHELEGACGASLLMRQSLDARSDVWQQRCGADRTCWNLT